MQFIGFAAGLIGITNMAVAGIAVGCLAAGFAVGFLLLKKASARSDAEARAEADVILGKAKEDADRFARDAEVRARDELVTRREAFDKEQEAGRAELRSQEKRISKKEDSLERRDQDVSKRDRQLSDQEKRLADRQESLTQRSSKLDGREAEIDQKLLETAELSREEAERQVLVRVEEELGAEKDKMIRNSVAQTRDEVEAKSLEIVLTSIQRLGTMQMSEATVSTVDVPNDEMKGRIIGREGRNIRAFEKATGVDVIVDDTPGVIVVSAFDGVRREVARRTMVQLIKDGRVHPSRIEEVVGKIRRDMDSYLKETGKKACAEMGIRGLHGKLIDLLGRLRYRTSYGQNVLDHLLETAHIAGAMASELKIDVKLAKRCAFLHDIGKAIDHEVEGGHPAVGADVARRCGEKKEVVNAIASHHNDVPMESIYSVLTQICDGLSAGRPGARRETFDRYIERLQRLEDVASAFPGVDQVFAIQAGREVRVIVNNAKVSDKLAMKVARDIAREIEAELTYPGEVRVTLVRETRVVEYAR